MTYFFQSIQKGTKRHVALIFLICFGIYQGLSQSDKEQILAVRKASNEALKSYDNEKGYTYLTDDVLITTGNGTLLISKQALREYVLAFDDSKMYWIRTANDIEINAERGLAWETGTWKGYDPRQGNHAIIGGNYSAMWTKASGAWLIKSQLFVTLE